MTRAHVLTCYVLTCYVLACYVLPTARTRAVSKGLSCASFESLR